MEAFRPVEVRARGPVAAGAMAWRYRGDLHLTAIIKATFAIGVDGRLALAPPLDLLSADVHQDGDPRRSVVFPGDRVPFRPQADVVLTGAAYPPDGVAPVMVVRLGIRRDRVLINKTIRVVGDTIDDLGEVVPFARMPLDYEHALGGPGHADNPVGIWVEGVDERRGGPNLSDPRDAQRPIGFGPLARGWPIRARLAGSESQGRLDLAVAEIAADLDWTFFQGAPLDQRIDYLHGDEWILLDGLHPKAPRIAARLPEIRAEGTILGTLTAGGPSEQPLELDADQLHIDAERLLCTVTWRAAMPVASERDLAGLRVLLGITIAGQPALALPLQSPRAPFESAAHLPPLPRPPVALAPRAMPSAAHPLEGTLDLGPPPATVRLPGWSDIPPPAEAPEERTVALSTSALLGFTPSEPPRTVTVPASELVGFTPAPFMLAEPGEVRHEPAAPLPGTPWSSAPAPKLPVLYNPLEGTLDIEPETTPRRVVAPSAAPKAAEPGAPPRPPAPPAKDVWAQPEPPRAEPAARPAPAPNLTEGLYRRFGPKKR